MNSFARGQQLLNEGLTDLERVRKTDAPHSAEAEAMNKLTAQLSAVNTALNKMRQALSPPRLEFTGSFDNSIQRGPRRIWDDAVILLYVQVFNVTVANPPNGALIHFYDADGQQEVFQTALQLSSGGPLYLPSQGLAFKRNFSYMIDFAGGAGPEGTWAYMQGVRP